MGTEAQKLISLSLEKIANSRRRRREMSLHKNLLLTTVIHKARMAIMEETYYMMNYAETTEYVAAAEDNPMYADGHRASSYGQPPHYLQPVDTDAEAAALSAYVEDAMEWEEDEGSSSNNNNNGSVPLIIMTSSNPVCDETDKENQCPSSTDMTTQDNDGEFGADFVATCCEQRFGACRSPDCQFLVRCGQKRLRPCGGGSTDDSDSCVSAYHHHHHPASSALHLQPSSPAKKLKWDDIDSRDMLMDPESDTSHALRLVSVLSASLSGNGTSSSSSTCQPAVRLVRSISTPDLCSKQAKDAMEDMVDRHAVLAIAV